jgi:predicted Zn-dependent protease
VEQVRKWREKYECLSATHCNNLGKISELKAEVERLKAERKKQLERAFDAGIGSMIYSDSPDPTYQFNKWYSQTYPEGKEDGNG